MRDLGLFAAVFLLHAPTLASAQEAPAAASTEVVTTEAVTAEEVTPEEVTPEVENTELENTEVENTEVENTEVENTEADFVVVGSEPMWFLVGIGSGLFLGEYLGEIAITAATGGTRSEVETTAIPLAGAWLELTDGRPREWWQVGLGVMGGVAQIAGLAVLVVGLSWHRPTRAPRSEVVTLLPMGLPGGAGVSVSGAF